MLILNHLHLNERFERKLTMKNLLIATTLMSFSINTLAVEWTSIITKPKYEILVDIDSYDMANGYPFILTKTVFKQEQSLLTKAPNKPYIYTIKKMQFNCKNPLFKVNSTDFFNRKDKLVGKDNAKHEFSPIIQGTDEFSVGQLVCQVHQMVGGQ